MKTINQAILTLALAGSVLAQEHPKATSRTSSTPSQGIWGIPLNNPNIPDTRPRAAPAATPSPVDNIWPIPLEPNGKGTPSKANGTASIKGSGLKAKIPQHRLLHRPNVTVPPKKAPRPFSNPYLEVGTIRIHHPRYDFYVVDRGSDNGIEAGDKYTIFRSGKAVGYIEITRVQPTVSSALSQRGKPKPPVPFKVGDKVIKID
jgi:hypothetical protein